MPKRLTERFMGTVEGLLVAGLVNEAPVGEQRMFDRKGVGRNKITVFESCDLLKHWARQLAEEPDGNQLLVRVEGDEGNSIPATRAAALEAAARSCVRRPLLP
jgi:hypothetical protein